MIAFDNGLSGLFDIPIVIPEIMVHGKVSWWKTNQGFLMERRCLSMKPKLRETKTSLQLPYRKIIGAASAC
jgi:hypothetical protein